MTGAVPEHALLLRDFANTVAVDDGTDALAEPASLTAWLRDRGLIPAPADGADETGRHDACDADDTDVEIAIALRTSLRAAMRAHHQRPASGTAAPANTAAHSIASARTETAATSTGGQPTTAAATGTAAPTSTAAVGTHGARQVRKARDPARTARHPARTGSQDTASGRQGAGSGAHSAAPGTQDTASGSQGAGSGTHGTGPGAHGAASGTTARVWARNRCG